MIKVCFGLQNLIFAFSMCRGKFKDDLLVWYKHQHHNYRQLPAYTPKESNLMGGKPLTSNGTSYNNSLSA
jgi:hypothetical protein